MRAQREKEKMREWIRAWGAHPIENILEQCLHAYEYKYKKIYRYFRRVALYLSLSFALGLAVSSNKSSNRNKYKLTDIRPIVCASCELSCKAFSVRYIVCRTLFFSFHFIVRFLRGACKNTHTHTHENASCALRVNAATPLLIWVAFLFFDCFR